MGCSSGEQSCGWEWMKESRKGAISTESSYPYTSKGGNAAACKSSLGSTGATISGYASIPSNEVQMAAWTAKNGPMSVAAYALPWKHYTGGIMTSGCSGDIDHAVLITGYGSENGQAYWVSLYCLSGVGVVCLNPERTGRGANYCLLRVESAIKSLASTMPRAPPPQP